MSIKQTLNEIISKSSGSRLGEHAILPTKRVELFSEDVRFSLRSQWENAGRDAARIFVKLDEEDGSSIYLTGWDGETKFVGQSDAGFGYIESKRITGAKIDEDWDNQLTLGHVRKNLDEMDKTQVADLVSRLKKCLTKRSKNRRQSEVKNFVKRFQKACAADKAKEDEKSKAIKTEAKDDDKKKPDKKGEYSWHTKGNRVVPVKEGLGSAIANFKAISESMKQARKQYKAGNAGYNSVLSGEKSTMDMATSARGRGETRGPQPLLKTVQSYSIEKGIPEKITGNRNTPYEFKRGNVSRTIQKLKAKKGSK